MKNQLVKIVTVSMLGLYLSGCAGAGYQMPPSTKELAQKEIKVENDTFNKSLVVSTPSYLIRDGFTDTFPVILQYILIKKDNVDTLKIALQINDIKSGMYYDAIGEDGFKFSFEPIQAGEQVSSLSTSNITRVGNVGYVNTSTMNVTKDSMYLYLTMEQLHKMVEINYQIKMYGKKKEGIFKIPAYISQAFYENIQNYKK